MNDLVAYHCQVILQELEFPWISLAPVEWIPCFVSPYRFQWVWHTLKYGWWMNARSAVLKAHGLGQKYYQLILYLTFRLGWCSGRTTWSLWKKTIKGWSRTTFAAKRWGFLLMALAWMISNLCTLRVWSQCMEGDSKRRWRRKIWTVSGNHSFCLLKRMVSRGKKP